MADGTTKHQSVSPLPNIVTELRDVCIHTLRSYFAHQPEGFMRWQNDERATDLFIADQYPDEAGASDHKPAIIVERGGASRHHPGHTDGLTVGALGGPMHTRSWGLVVPCVFHCISEYPLQAEDLQWLTHAVLALYLNEMASRSNIEDLDEMTLQPPQPLEGEQYGPTGAGSWYDAPLACQWRVRVSFGVSEPEHAPLRRVVAGVN